MIISILCMVTQFSFSQPTGRGRPPHSGANSKIVTGIVLEAETNKPIEYVTIFLVDKSTNKNIGGGTTNQKGRFTIPYKSPNFYIKLTFMGAKTKKIDTFKAVGGRINLGKIKLESDMKVLKGAEIEGETSETVFELDKRVFNVGKDLSSTGAGALEVLDNVPSVNVSVEGKITLRGGEGVQILIDGKPSIMTEGNTLSSIPAASIDRIEVITNPSAKYQAEGSTGIINIILKKEEKKGTNGSLSLNLGYPLSNSLGFSLNNRTKKWNLFTQFGAGRRVLPSINKSKNHNLIRDTKILSNDEGSRNETFYNLSLGTDYYINKNNVLTLSGRYAYELEDEGSDLSYQYLEGNTIIQKWRREESTISTNPKWQYDLKYHKDFDRHKEQDFSISFTGRSFSKDKESDFLEENTFGVRPLENQDTRAKFGMANHTIKADYTHPFTEKVKAQTGLMYVIDDLSNDFEVANIVDNKKVINQGLSNVFDFKQNVLGAYLTFAYKVEKWGVKTGLRFEQTELETFLLNTKEQNSQSYNNLFPSAHISYNINKRVSLQAGYSKRIYRPSLWALNPFYSIRNNYSYYAGNPKLTPEFTDSYEVSSIITLKKWSFNTSLYRRFTTDKHTRLIKFEGNTSILSVYNLGKNQYSGFELNSEYQPNRKLTLSSDLNLMTNQNKVTFEGENLDFESFYWRIRGKVKMKLPKDFAFELTLNYKSDQIKEQGEKKDVLYANLGVRKKIMKGKIVPSLSVRDIFASRINRYETIRPTFTSYGTRTRGRFIRFGISYSFGKGEAMQYSGGGRR